MFQLQAPYPAIEATSLLPNAQFSDGEGLTDEVQVKRTLDGTLYTYVKTKNGRRQLTWDFLITRNKCLEVEEFVRAYIAQKIKITDHRDRVWVGYFTDNPIEFTSAGRGKPGRDGFPGEMYTCTLTFEGVQQ